MPCIHSDIAFEVKAIKEQPLVLPAHHSSLVHNFNSFLLIGPFSAVFLLPFLFILGYTPSGKYLFYSISPHLISEQYGHTYINWRVALAFSLSHVKLSFSCQSALLMSIVSAVSIFVTL